MIPLLHAMHIHAAKRGDGLKNEFFHHFGRSPVKPARLVVPAATGNRTVAKHSSGAPQTVHRR